MAEDAVSSRGAGGLCAVICFMTTICCELKQVPLIDSDMRCS